MKRKVFLSLLLCLGLMLCLFASCSAAPSDSAEDYYSGNNGSGITKDEAIESTGGDTEISEFTQKIIQNLYLTIEVEDVEVSYQTLLDKAIALGGYEFSRNYSSSGDYQSLSAVIKVPADRLVDFTKDAETIGSILNNELTSEDISESYYDVQTRLTTMEKTLEKYYEFLEQAQTLDEQLSITKQIDQLTYEIEALKGKIAKWDNQVNYATVTLHMYEYDDPSLEKQDIQWNSLSWDDMWYLIKSGFTGFTSFIVSALQWILVALASTAIFSVPGLILVIWLIVRSRKKKKAKKLALQQAQEAKKAEKEVAKEDTKETEKK